MNTEIASTNVEYGGIIPDHRKIRLNLSKKWNSLELWKTVYHSLFSDVARIGVVFCWNSNPFYTCRALFQFLSQCCCVGIHSRQSVATMHLRLLFLFTNSIDPLIQLPFFFDFVHDYPHPHRSQQHQNGFAATHYFPLVFTPRANSCHILGVSTPTLIFQAEVTRECSRIKQRSEVQTPALWSLLLCIILSTKTFVCHTSM